MLTRFCLYGFLKNQRYFEHFFILILLDYGLTFFEIGVLVAIREVTTNALELLSGALADTWGRRRAMVTSFLAYIFAFTVLALAASFWLIALAMALLGVGDAFRSGTHKAMILTWLRSQGRESERAAIYGKTRSWSKLGSALGVIVGAACVLAGVPSRMLFWMALVPYTLDLANMATYPAWLDGERAREEISPAQVWAHTVDSAKSITQDPQLRGLLLETSAFMGIFKVAKDYLQPVLQAAVLAGVLAIVITPDQDDTFRQTALLVGPTYLLLFLLSAWMSRNAGRLVKRAADEESATRWLWCAWSVTFVFLLGGVVAGFHAFVIVAFVMLYALESLWRPVILSRFDEHGEEYQGATLLSVESQARSVTTMVLAPLLGAAVDAGASSGVASIWPVALAGAALGIVFTTRALVRSRGE